MTGTHPLADRSAIGATVGRVERIVVCLDFDGTLVPIVPDPEDARLDRAGERVLTRLADRSGVTVGIVSGRSLADVRERAGVGGVALAGNHGLEIDTDDGTWTHPEVARLRPRIDRLVAACESAVSDVSGAFVEAKGPTASVHVRHVPDGRRDTVTERIGELVETTPGITLSSGKEVLELRPAIDWNKGDAIAEIAGPNTSNALVVYAGDDHTDVDGFDRVASLPGSHVTIAVGGTVDGATHHLPTPSSLLRWLQWLDCTRREAVSTGLPV